jgi:hypothetical protein
MFFLKVLHICYNWTFGYTKKPFVKGFGDSWCRQQELNPQPTDKYSVILTTELYHHAEKCFTKTQDPSMAFTSIFEKDFKE